MDCRPCGPRFVCGDGELSQERARLNGVGEDRVALRVLRDGLFETVTQPESVAEARLMLISAMVTGAGARARRPRIRSKEEYNSKAMRSQRLMCLRIRSVLRSH